MAEGVKETIKYAQLPLVSTLLDTASVTTAVSLLEEMEAIQRLVEIHTERGEEIKQELAELQKEAGLTGLRWGELCFVSRQMPGKSSLNKTKLMEVAGVTAAQMKECTDTGKPFEQKTFKNLSRKSAEQD